jgi:hypothetical protein
LRRSATLRPTWTSFGAFGIASTFGLLLAVNLLVAAIAMDRNEAAADRRLTLYRRWKPVGVVLTVVASIWSGNVNHDYWVAATRHIPLGSGGPTDSLDDDPRGLRDAALVVDRQAIQRRSRGGITRHCTGPRPRSVYSSSNGRRRGPRPVNGNSLSRLSKRKAAIVHQEKWPSPLPEPGSAKDRSLRFVTGIVMVPFGALWIAGMGYEAVNAARKLDIGALLALVVGATWFGFITWSAVKYAFTGYNTLAFVRLWNATWGWVGKRMPLPPSEQRK